MGTYDYIIKFAVIAALSPVWWPIVRTLYAEAQGALRREGGLFGRTPTVREMQRIEARKGEYVSGLLDDRNDRGWRSGGGRAGRGRSNAGGQMHRPRRSGF